MDREHPLRIGYFNQDFLPEVGAGPARILEMAQHWQRAGADVTVITGMPSRRLPGLADGTIHPDYRGKLFMEEEWHGIRVLRSWVYRNSSGGAVQTMLNNGSFMVTGAIHALLKAGKFDVIIASSPPFLAQFAAEAIRLTRRAPMVLEMRDLWPDYMVEMGMLKNRWLRKALFGMETYLLRHSQRSVVVTASTRERVARKGVPKEHIHVIPNGVDLNRYYRSSEPPPLPALRRSEGESVVGYLGTFGISQDLGSVVDAAGLVERENPHVRFVFAGDGREKEEVVKRARTRGLSNVSFHGPIPKEQTRAFYTNCDICLVPLAPLDVLQETVPSKIFEIMACETPVLASVGGEAAEIVRRSGGGSVTSPGSAPGIAAGVLELLAMKPEQRADMGRKGREHVAQHYTRERLAEQYLEILATIAGPVRPVVE